MHRRSASVFVLAILAGIPAASFAQNYGLSSSLNSIPGHPGLGQDKVTIDLPGKVQPAAAFQGVPQVRPDSPRGLDIAPPRLEGEAQVNGFVKGKKMKVSGSLSEKGASATGSSRRGAKADIRHLPTCD